MKITKTLFLLMFLTVYSLGYSQPHAIPGALGLAKDVRGAYAGSSTPAILYVDRLTDDEKGNNGDNKGSLRWCLTRDYPRIILFEVSGYINLDSTILVENDCGYVSIYGQTAPSPGITISGVNVIDFRCDNIILQHLRFRSAYSGTGQIDALSFQSTDSVFVDHCSFSYAKDENVGISGSSGDMSSLLTFQNCIFSNPLNYESGKGLLAQDNVLSGSVIRSAFIHCGIRSPYPNGVHYKRWENVNTIAYNPHYWGQEFTGGDTLTHDVEISIIGNFWKAGPQTTEEPRPVVRIREAMTEGSEIYLYNNYSPTRVGSSEWDGVVKYEGTRDSTDYKVDTPFSWAETNYYPYDVLEDSLVANAGARPWDRDSVDIIALNDMVNKTGSWITYQSEAYYPPLAENSITLDVPANPHVDAGNGYTNLEVWVYEMTKDSSSGTPPSDTCNYLSISGIVVNETDNGANGAITTSTTGGTPAYSYLWEDGSITENRINLSEGTYVVTVTDAKGCADTAGFNVINIDSGSGFMDTVLIDSILINPTVQAMTDNGWINMLTSSITSDTISIYEINFIGSNGIGYTPITGWPDNVAGSFHYGNSYNGIRMIVKNISSDYIYRVEGISNRNDTYVRNQYVSVHGDTITVDVMDENNCTYSFDNVKAIGDSITIAVDPISSYYTYINGIKIYVYEIQPVQRTYNSLIGTSVNSNRQIESINGQIPFQLYPNPAANNLTISDLQVGARVYIYNSKGQSVLKTVATSDNLEISLTGFTPGFYITKVEIGGKLYTSKFIKQ